MPDQTPRAVPYSVLRRAGRGGYGRSHVAHPFLVVSAGALALALPAAAQAGTVTECRRCVQHLSGN